jgi:hypothetical protein
MDMQSIFQWVRDEGSARIDVNLASLGGPRQVVNRPGTIVVTLRPPMENYLYGTPSVPFRLIP